MTLLHTETCGGRYGSGGGGGNDGGDGSGGGGGGGGGGNYSTGLPLTPLDEVR